MTPISIVNIISIIYPMNFEMRTHLLVYACENNGVKKVSLKKGS